MYFCPVSWIWISIIVTLFMLFAVSQSEAKGAFKDVFGFSGELFSESQPQPPSPGRDTPRILSRRSPQQSPDDEDEDDANNQAEEDLPARKPTGETGDPLKDVNVGELYIPNTYSRFQIPRMFIGGMAVNEGEKASVAVSVHIRIISIGEINEIDEQIGFEMAVMLEWIDYGLFGAAMERNFGHSTTLEMTDQQVLDPDFLQKIWKPDIFMEGLIEAKHAKLMGKPASLKFGTSGGMMTYKTRVRVLVECDFDFKYYPADTQKCDIVLRSYAHTSDQFKLGWRPPIGLYLLYPTNDNFDIAVGGVKRLRFMSQLDRNNSAANETVDAIQFTISARRKLSYHLVQTYIPSLLYIAITWLCFMVPRKMIEARLAIVMTTLLTLTAMFASVRESTPVVSYTKAIDIWMVACIAFVFGVLMEFSVLLWTESVAKWPKDERDQNQKKLHEETQLMQGQAPRECDDEDKEQGQTRIKQPPSISEQFNQKLLHRATAIINFIEAHSFILILLIFVLFIVLYWSWLLIYSGYFDWYVDPTHNAGDEEEDVNILDVTELNPFINIFME